MSKDAPAITLCLNHSTNDALFNVQKELSQDIVMALAAPNKNKLIN